MQDYCLRPIAIRTRPAARCNMNEGMAEHELEQRNRLPTLMEVLGRRTLAPVDLFSFYIYMRDQQRSVDYLDFWYVVPFKT